MGETYVENQRGSMGEPHCRNQRCYHRALSLRIEIGAQTQAKQKEENPGNDVTFGAIIVGPRSAWSEIKKQDGRRPDTGETKGR